MLAPGRAERPDAFVRPIPESTPEAAERCPFCEGREDRTPPEVWANRPAGGEPDTPGWLTRSVPNLYPVIGGGEAEHGAVETGLASSADPLHDSRRTGEIDLFGSQPASGAHEVIVSCPQHATSLADLDEAQFAVAVEAWRERMRVHSPESAYVHLIVNEGPDAGASLEHSHAQLYALDFVPADIARERERAGAYNLRTMGGNLLGDVAVQEVRKRERLVAIDDDAMLVCPWASRSPFEVRVVPRTAAPSFESDGEVGTAMLREALSRLAAVFGSLPQLNIWIRTAPRGVEEFCWHIDIAPRLTTRAGFELGTGVEINVYPPEKAAADLRDAG